MLLGNFSIRNANPGREIGGPSNPSQWLKGGTLATFYASEAAITGETNKSAIPNGYVPPYSLVLSPKAGGLASIGNIAGIATVLANATKGQSLGATIAGLSDFSNAPISLIVQAAATLAASGALNTPALVGTVALAVDIAGAGDLNGALGSIAFVVASITGTGAIAAPDLNEIAELSAEISPFTVLSPESLAAAVWNALAADFQDAGTMGEKVGKKLLTLQKFLALK